MRRLIFKGLRDGFPIGLGYFAVAFSLGITARGAGLTPLQGWIASFLNHASAGEYALYSLIAANAMYWEIAAVIFVTPLKRSAANAVTVAGTSIVAGVVPVRPVRTPFSSITSS